MTDNFQSGALIDTRPEEAKLKDYKFEEIVSAPNPVNWIEKPQSEWRHFPIFNQDGSGSCVAQTLAKLYGILYWLKNQTYIHFSATHIYQRRSNKPQGGMGSIDAFNTARDGVTLEELVPSQNMTDAQMDSIDIPQYKKDVGAIFKIPNYVTLPVGDIETVASVIQTTGKGVMLWFYFKNDEWTEHPVVKYPNLDRYAPDTARHSVTGIDPVLVGGKKCIIIDDSWGSSYGLAGERIIDEDFFKARNFFAAYPVTFAFDTSPIKPHYDESIISLQDCLKVEGLFPSNVESTGVYGPITIKAVNQFQVKYGLHPTGTGTVGPKTKAKLHELYPW